ncbi:MAG: ATP-binding protein [Myxococcaceae bacterium]
MGLTPTSANFQLVAEAAGLGFWQGNLVTGQVTGNAVYRAQHGLPPDGPILVDQVIESVHVDDRVRVRAAARRALEEGAPFDLDFRVVVGKEVRWLHCTGRVFRDDKGKPLTLDGVTLEVTDQRILEESLRQTLIEKNESLQLLELINSTGQNLAAELKLEKLVQGATDAATQLCRAAFGAFFYNVINERGEAYMLYTLSGVDREAFAKFPMPRATAVFEPTFKGTGIIRSDDIVKDARYGHNKPHHGMPEGHLPVRSYLAVPVMSRSGEVIGGLFFGHPSVGVFTERDEKLVAGLAAQVAVSMDNARLFQHAQEAIVARDNFLSVASHELRTPITSMKLQSQLMRRRITSGDSAAFTPDQISKLVSQTERSIQRLSRLVEDMLDISRIATGHLQLQLDTVNLSDLVREVADRFTAQATEQGNELELHLAQEISGKWDRDRLDQVITNLLSNALKYAPGTRIQLTTSQVGGDALVEVADSGPGIASEDQGRVFERFERVGGTRVSGLGLGLHISKHIVEAHGGCIGVTSSLGAGARFTVKLPNK